MASYHMDAFMVGAGPTTPLLLTYKHKQGTGLIDYKVL